MKKLSVKLILFICFVVVVFSFSGCLRNIDVSRLVEEPTKFKPPEVVESADKVFPGEVEYALQGSYMDITPEFGEKTRIKGMEYVVEMILDAYNNPDLVQDVEPSKRGFKNLIKIYNRQDQLLARFEVSSDFMLYARTDKNSSLFLLPEYAYYTIEYALWQAGASLTQPLENWERIPGVGDQRAQYDEKQLDLRLAHDIKTILVQKYGISEAYFINYDIYTTAEYSSSDVLTVRVYALVGYAGYSKMEEEIKTEDDEAEPEYKTLFAADYHNEKAARIVYTLVDSKYFRMTEYREHADYDEENKSSEQSRIRAIFPYEQMETVMAALSDTSNITLDINRQALDYLRVTNQGDIEID